MNTEIYRRFFQGFAIRACAIGGPRRVAFALKALAPDDRHDLGPDELATRIVTWAPDMDDRDEGFFMAQWQQGIARIVIAYDHAATQLVALDDDYYSLDPQVQGLDFFEIPSRDRFCIRSRSLAWIGGQIYACGTKRKLLRRERAGVWTDLTITDNNPALFQELDEYRKKRGNLLGTRCGFAALDGFSQDEIYCGGDGGDLWMYREGHWIRLDLPVSIDIGTITCCADGWVYLAGGSRGILRGRQDRWKLLEDTTGPSITDSAWFQGQLFVADERRLYVLQDERLTPYIFPAQGPQQYSFRGISSDSGVLVSYGAYQALLCDGAQWSEIVANPLLKQ